MPFQISVRARNPDGTSCNVPLAKKKSGYEIPSSFTADPGAYFAIKMRHTDPTFEDRYHIKIDPGIRKPVWDDMYQMRRTERVTFDSFNETIADPSLYARSGLRILIDCRGKVVDEIISRVISIYHEETCAMAETYFPDKKVQKSQISKEELKRALVGMEEDEARSFATGKGYSIRVLHEGKSQFITLECNMGRVNVTLDASGRVMDEITFG